MERDPEIIRIVNENSAATQSSILVASLNNADLSRILREAASSFTIGSLTFAGLNEAADRLRSLS